MAQNLFRRGATYWWRRRVPTILAKKLRWQETRLSLRTHVRFDAVNRAARVRLVTDMAFAQMEAALMQGVALTRERMEALLRDLVAHELDLAEQARALAPPRSEAELEAAVVALTERMTADHRVAKPRYMRSRRIQTKDGRTLTRHDWCLSRHPAERFNLPTSVVLAKDCPRRPTRKSSGTRPV